MNQPVQQMQQIVNEDMLRKMAAKNRTKIRLMPKDWEDERDIIQQYAEELSDAWKKKPFENNNGISSPGSLALYYFMRRLSPNTVAEIGSWRGFSTWVMEQAVPAAKFICIDPVFMLEQLLDKKQYEPVYRPVNAQKSGQDFSTLDIKVAPEATDKTVAFFDDHQNKMPRLLQALQRGFKHLLFDDNPPFKYTHLTFSHYLTTEEQMDKFFQHVESYEIFPPPHSALFPRSKDFRLVGLDLPEDGKFKYLADQKGHYSWITYVKLR